MRLKIITIAITIFFVSGIIFLTAHRVDAADARTVPVNELEDGLTDIEKELTNMEKEIDTLLEDLVDPKITSLSVFFSSQSIPGQVPVSIQLQMDSELLTTREFAETDRLVLLRGGAIEIYTGIAEPISHTLAVECLLSTGDPQGGIRSTGKTVFKFETGRAMANFLEITLSTDPIKKETTYKLNARHWSKEP